MNARKFLLFTALAEIPTGLFLLLSPAIVVRLLLGADFNTVPELVISRVCGAAILCIGIINGMTSRKVPVQSGRVVIAGMTVYNFVTMILLTCSAVQYKVVPLLLFAILVHAVLGVISIFLLRKPA
jgi:hypothetical protein